MICRKFWKKWGETDTAREGAKSEPPLLFLLLEESSSMSHTS